MPTVFHPLDEARATRSHPQPPPVQTDKPPIKLGDICVGCVVWLPPKDPTKSSILCVNEVCCGNEELDEGGHNHPVVVLNIRQNKGSTTVGDLICTVACVTTFSGTTLSKYSTKRRRRYREESIPIFDPEATPPSSPQATSLIQLKLEEGRLKKQSYIRLQHTYRVPASMLRQYAYRKCRAYKRRLSQESYCVLMGLLNMPSEKYEATKTFFETKNQRLLALASSSLLPVVHTRYAPTLAAPIAPEPDRYTSYATLPTTPRIARYTPPVHNYSTRHYVPPNNGAEHEEGDGWSFISKCAMWLAVGAVIWWSYRRVSSV